MFSYNPDSRILKVQKITEPELELNLLEYQQESYKKYVSSTIYSDMEYLLQAMREQLQVSQVDATFRVGDVYCGNYKREVKKQSPSYFPVYAKFTIDGANYPNEVEVLRIPAMDADGILNVNGARRILLMQMVAAERVSYAADRQTVSVTTPHRNISLIFDGTKDVMIKYGSKAKIPMHKLIRAYNSKEKVYDDPSKLFRSAFILSAFATDAEATNEAIEDELDKLKVYATYSGDEYALGKTRDALNEALSLDRARGRILSRAVDSFEPGKRVDDEVLRYVHKHCINELYVKAVPDVVGYTLTQELVVSFVPAGTRNNARLQEELPQFAAYASIPQDRTGSNSHMFRNAFSYKDILDTKVLTFDFGMLESGTSTDQAMFKLRVLDMTLLNDQYVSHKYKRGEWTGKVLEESGIAADYLIKLYAKDFMLRRAQNQVTILLGNSISSLANNPSATGILENANILVLGALNKSSREYLTEEFGLDKECDELEALSTNPDFTNTFLLVNKMQKDATTALLRAHVPQNVVEGKLFKVVDTEDS